MLNKVSFYTTPYPGIKSEFEFIDVAVEHGLTAIEGYPFFELRGGDLDVAKRVREYADKRGITFPCFSMCADVRNEIVAEEALTKKYVEMAHILGSPYFHHTIVPEAYDPKLVLPKKDEYFKKGVEFVKKISDYAGNLGMRAIYEPQGYIFNGIENLQKLIDDVDNNIGIVADFGNIYQSKDDTISLIKAFKDKICQVHVKDVYLHDDNKEGKYLESTTGRFVQFVDFGKGIVDFNGAIKLLKEIGYDGYYSIEYAAPSDDAPTIKDALKFLDKLL